MINVLPVKIISLLNLIVAINSIYFIIFIISLLEEKVKFHSHTDISIKESKAITYKIQLHKLL